MQQYIGTKIITAYPLEKDGKLGYGVIYEDGYNSWSPKDVFEASYRAIEREGQALTFGDALHMLKLGKKVARAGWNGVQPKTGFFPPSRAPVVYEGLCYVLLASGEVAYCDAEDYDIIAHQENWALMGNGYPSYTDNSTRSTVKMHQLLLPAAEMVDHQNGNKLDNRRRNLRPCSSAENNANRPSLEGSSSRFKGVTWDKARNKWMAAIAAGGRSKTIGRFDLEEDAARAYDAAAKQAYGAFAKLNFTDPRMWLAYSPGSEALPADKFWSGPNRDYAECRGGFATVLPSITMKTATGEILMGWLASQTDMLAEDWRIVD